MIADGGDAFALVFYIPGPLGAFLDGLRRELEPRYTPSAHVSVLSPRPLHMDWEAASRQARALAEARPPFTIQLTEPRVFPATGVIYLDIGAGAGELHELHDALNRGDLAFGEPFPYHPHVTLAQSVPAERRHAAFGLACRRWREFAGVRSFPAQSAVLVRNSGANGWVDMARYTLGAARRG